MNSFTKALFHVQLLVIENPSKTHQQNIHAYISKYKAKQQKKSFLCVDGNVRLCVLLCSNVDMFAENIHGKMRNNKKKAKGKNSMNILNKFYKKKYFFASSRSLYRTILYELFKYLTTSKIYIKDIARCS